LTRSWANCKLSCAINYSMQQHLSTVWLYSSVVLELPLQRSK